MAAIIAARPMPPISPSGRTAQAISSMVSFLQSPPCHTPAMPAQRTMPRYDAALFVCTVNRTSVNMSTAAPRIGST
jgi:hypothetical protein